MVSEDLGDQPDEERNVAVREELPRVVAGPGGLLSGLGGGREEDEHEGFDLSLLVNGLLEVPVGEGSVGLGKASLDGGVVVARHPFGALEDFLHPVEEALAEAVGQLEAPTDIAGRDEVLQQVSHARLLPVEGFRRGGDILLSLGPGLEQVVEIGDSERVCEGLVAADDVRMQRSRDGPRSPGHAAAAHAAAAIRLVGSARGCRHAGGVGVGRL